MPRLAREDRGEENAPISAEARKWCPDPSAREDGGRRVELEASGVLLRLPTMLLADMAVTCQGVTIREYYKAVVMVKEGQKIGRSGRFEAIVLRGAEEM